MRAHAHFQIQESLFTAIQPKPTPEHTNRRISGIIKIRGTRETKEIRGTRGIRGIEISRNMYKMS
jgi:hypothetical protein